MKPKYKTFTDFLERYNFNATRLAKRVGVTRQTANNWISGRSLPLDSTIGEIQKVIDSYDTGVDARKFFVRTEENRGRPKKA